MTEQARESAALSQREVPSPETVAQTSASLTMLREVQDLQRRTNLDGQDCRSPARAGDIPMMFPGEPTDGCTVGNVGESRVSQPGALEFNTEALYRQALRETVRVDTNRQTPDGIQPSPGSGVIVGREGEECYILTANHVLANLGPTRVLDHSVRMANGATFPSQLRFTDLEHDRAIISINTGAATDAICTPARIGTGAEPGTQGWIAGFPHHSRTMMLSPARVDRITNEEEQTAVGLRRIPSIEATSHTMGGNSGGPMYNERGEVVATVRSGPNPLDDPEGAMRSTDLAPVDREIISRALEQARRR